tara:strand:+ start:453 stop:722 length:270 start_codon:yes stop_codon:yes gene_type:complete
MQKLIFLLIFFLFFNNLNAKDEYFLTLRNDKVNLRQGPSFDYPVKIFYKKKFLPVLIQDRSDNFRKIRTMKIIQVGYIFLNSQKKKQQS